MGSMGSQITSLTIVYSAIYLGADQRKHQSSGSLAFVRGIQRGPVNLPHKWPVTRKMFPFDDVIMVKILTVNSNNLQHDNVVSKNVRFQKFDLNLYYNRYLFFVCICYLGDRFPI